MPRLWMVPTVTLCRKHLVAEHHECHVFLGKLTKRQKLDGFIAGNLFALADLHARHENLVAEMQARGYRHLTPFPPADVVSKLGDYLPPHPPVQRELAASALHARCPDCKALKENQV